MTLSSSLSTIGILGAGQLGKMLCEAASTLGFATHVFAPDSDPIAAQVATHFTSAEYNDIEALQKFASSVDVITLEFENVPVAPLKTLSFLRKQESSNQQELDPVFQRDDGLVKLLETTQHRVREKTLAQSLGIGTAPFMAVNSREDLERAMTEIGTPGILKTCTMGYDGKGQWKIDDRLQITDDKMDSSLSSVICHPSSELIYEGFINFTQEISVIVARSASGEIQCFEPAENVHKNHILHTTTVPANISAEVAKKAEAIAIKLANALEVLGLLAVELFVTSTGEVLVNEMAPRPHNSGHWTMDGCNVSQFEQVIRAVAGLPLIKPERTAKKVVMTNLIGEDVNNLETWKKQGAHIHIYGKKEVRAGRKMGHVTQLS